jgi:hypothetical protein
MLVSLMQRAVTRKADLLSVGVIFQLKDKQKHTDSTHRRIRYSRTFDFYAIRVLPS